MLLKLIYTKCIDVVEFPCEKGVDRKVGFLQFLLDKVKERLETFSENLTKKGVFIHCIMAFFATLLKSETINCHKFLKDLFSTCI
jgi:hypothetical protein